MPVHSNTKYIEVRMHRTPFLTKVIREAAFVVFLLLMHCTASIAEDEEIAIAYGAPGKPPVFTYHLFAATEQDVGFKLVNGSRLAETGQFRYRDGFAGFKSDVVEGFRDAILITDFNKLDELGSEEPREFSITVGSQHNKVVLRFIGTWESYGLFLEKAPRLQDAFSAAGNGRARMYRLWQK